jgi:hypothetical protein
MSISFSTKIKILVLWMMLITSNFALSQVENKVRIDTLPKKQTSFSLDVSSDFVSRFIWRGQPFEQSFCVQPTLELNIGDFTIGTWGSYSIFRDQLDEHDLYLTFNLNTSIGGFAINFWDYYNSNVGKNFFNYKDEDGAHVLEFSLRYTGPESFPLTFFGAYNFHCDPDHSTYIQLGYNTNIKDIKLNLFCGGTKGNSCLYSVQEDKLAIIYTGISATKTVKITNDFSIPFGVSYIMNPYSEKSFLIFKISI